MTPRYTPGPGSKASGPTVGKGTGCTDRPGRRSPKRYVLDFFPSFGGRAECGPLPQYVPTDVLSRYYRMRGENVLHPMGWDAFGLPAENAAIRQKTNPAKLIARYAANYKRRCGCWASPLTEPGDQLLAARILSLDPVGFSAALPIPWYDRDCRKPVPSPAWRRNWGAGEAAAFQEPRP